MPPIYLDIYSWLCESDFFNFFNTKYQIYLFSQPMRPLGYFSCVMIITLLNPISILNFTLCRAFINITLYCLHYKFHCDWSQLQCWSVIAWFIFITFIGVTTLTQTDFNLKVRLQFIVALWLTYGALPAAYYYYYYY